MGTCLNSVCDLEICTIFLICDYSYRKEFAQQGRKSFPLKMHNNNDDNDNSSNNNNNNNNNNNKIVPRYTDTSPMFPVI